MVKTQTPMNILVIILCITSCHAFFNFNQFKFPDFNAIREQLNQVVKQAENSTSEALPVVQQIVMGVIENGTARFNITNIQNNVNQTIQQVQNLTANASPIINSLVFSVLESSKNISSDAQKAGEELLKESDALFNNLLIPKAQNFALEAIKFFDPVWNIFSVENSFCVYQCSNKSNIFSKIFDKLISFLKIKNIFNKKILQAQEI
jgi:hypothetical protein